MSLGKLAKRFVHSSDDDWMVGEVPEFTKFVHLEVLVLHESP